MISTVLSIPFIFLVSLFILKKVRSLISADFQKSSIGNFLDKLFAFQEVYFIPLSIHRF